MDLAGNLKLFKPSAIFQFFQMHGLTGLLKLITVQDMASFYFENGNLIYADVDTRKKKKIGDYLLELGKIDEAQLRDALETFRNEKGLERVGEILVERGHLKRSTLVATIQEQMKEVVYEVLTWDEGQFVFMEGISPEGEDIFLDVKIDYLILEGFRRYDESVGFATLSPLGV